MQQSSTKKTPQHYLILGSGRAVSHFVHYLALLGLPFSQWSRRLEPVPGKLLKSRLQAATHVLALVSDGAIEELVRQAKALENSPSITWIHCSGSLVTTEAIGCHPLMTFSPSRKYDLETYRSMAFIVDKGAPLFSTLMPGFPNPHYRIDPAKKALYHALCVLSGNFTALLWNKLFNELEGKMLIPKHAALPYLRAVCANLEASPETALTGPLVRGDGATIQRNLESLAQDPYSDVYEAFVRAYATRPSLDYSSEVSS